MLLATYALCARDVVRFYRQRSRIVGALGTPVVFWLLLGSGLGRSFRLGPDGVVQAGYIEYFYPGTLALIVLFTAIFSTISVIEDRHAGFLQGVLVAPVSRASIVVSKIFAGATLALIQAALFLLLAPVAQIEVRPGSLPMLGLVLASLAFALTGLGFILAWLLDSTQGFHALMNLVLVPMWMLSGAVFPAVGAAGWIRAVMVVNPMTYGVSAIRAVLTGTPAPGDPPVALSLVVIVSFGAAALTIGTVVVRVRRR